MCEKDEGGSAVNLLLSGRANLLRPRSPRFPAQVLISNVVACISCDIGTVVWKLWSAWIENDGKSKSGMDL
jgi:hypothetical protein